MAFKNILSSVKETNAEIWVMFYNDLAIKCKQKKQFTCRFDFLDYICLTCREAIFSTTLKSKCLNNSN